MFEKNLQDLVKGIRSTKGDVSVYISQALQEIKAELRNTDPFVKAQAVRKLTYLHMLGYDMCWAAFHVVEVMSYERFSHKRIGYNAACQSFTQSTDVVLLCTNLLKKEFGSTSEYEVGLAINVLANIVTTDLARDLLGDVLAMMGSPKPYVRKKATLVLFKMFLRYPQGLRLSFDRLKERMEEPDVTVVSCAVNVICELANKKPKNYLGLAPQFFRLLTTSSNNWMLIKVVKLLASLVPEEPRLARKLLDPLATVIQNTPAKSLLYECISTVTTALLYTKKSDGSQPRNVAAVVRLCNDHLRRYIEDPDQNLRYLGLVGLGNLMKSHPYVVTEHQELIVECLTVDDITIRMRALELLSGMVNPDNAAPIIRELMRQTLSADGAYRHELITHILHVCSVNKYANIHDFDWYIHVLVQLARVPGNTAATVDASLSSLAPSSGSMLDASSSSNHKMKVTDEEPAKRSHGVEVARQLVDIAVRVKSVRSVMVDNMIELLMEKEALSGPGAGTLQEVYYAAAWITGEYVMEFLDDVDDEDEEDDEDRETEEDKLQRLEELADEMLQLRTTTLPGHVQTVFIQALLKVLTAMAERADDPTVERIATVIMERLPAFVQSEYIEVQERAVSLQQLLLALGMGLGALTAQERTERAFDGSASLDPAKRLDVLNSFFVERLAPVGVKAQRKVPLPGDLDLDEPLSNSEAKFLESGGDVSAFSSEDDLEVSFVSQGHAGVGGGYNGIGDGSPERKPGSKHHRQRQHHGSSSSESESESENSADEKERKEREYVREQERLRKDPFYLSAGSKASADAGVNAGFADMMGALGSSTNGKKKKASKKSKSRDILEDELMPEGARSSDEDRRRSRKKRGSVGGDETDLSAVDLSIPLAEDEKVPTDQWFHRQTPSAKPTEGEKKSKKKISKHKKAPRGEDDDKKKRKKKETSSKSSKSKKSSRKQEDLLIGGFSDDDQEEAEVQESRHHHRSSSAKKSHKKSSSKIGGEAEKGKKKRKDKSSKRQEAPPADAPLLLF
ncbi:hypothetical protein PRNP1_002824 [Phytophthora ramorum]